MNNDDLTFGALHREIRIRNGATLRSYCRDNGFNPGNVSKMERGILRPPTIDHLHKYLDALHVDRYSVDWRILVDLALKGRSEIDRLRIENERLRNRLDKLQSAIRALNSLLRQDAEPDWYNVLGMTPETAAAVAVSLKEQCYGWGRALEKETEAGNEPT